MIPSSTCTANTSTPALVSGTDGVGALCLFVALAIDRVHTSQVNSSYVDVRSPLCWGTFPSGFPQLSVSPPGIIDVTLLFRAP